MTIVKRTKLALALTLALLFSAVAGTKLINSVRANPYIHNGVKEGEISPPDGTKPPIILISSPKNNTAYASNNVSLTLNVSMPASNNVPLHISEIYYRASWQKDRTDIDLLSLFVKNNYTWPSLFSVNMTEVPEGPRWLEVCAVATGFAYETRHEVKGIYYTTYYVGYKISSSSVVNFTIDTTPPSISVLAMENKIYDTSEVSLSFAVNEPVSQIAYSLDGQANLTIAGNTTLTDLSGGAHSVTVYAADIAGNIGASEMITFTIAKPEPQPEPFQTAPLAATSGALVAVISIGLIAYFKKRKR